MYEIWQALNIVWELALPVWPWLTGAALLWLALVLAARGRGWAAWRAAFSRSLALGAVLALLSAAMLPSLTRSSFSEMGYWVDWANLLAIALGGGAAAALFAWPLLSMRGPRPR